MRRRTDRLREELGGGPIVVDVVDVEGVGSVPSDVAAAGLGGGGAAEGALAAVPFQAGLVVSIPHPPRKTLHCRHLAEQLEGARHYNHHETNQADKIHESHLATVATRGLRVFQHVDKLGHVVVQPRDDLQQQFFLKKMKVLNMI